MDQHNTVQRLLSAHPIVLILLFTDLLFIAIILCVVYLHWRRGVCISWTVEPTNAMHVPCNHSVIKQRDSRA